MEPLAPLEVKLLRSWPLETWRDHRVLVAVSGGPDSVALLRALERLHPEARQRLVVGHVNHLVRGPEAEQDERFVRRLAERLSLSCHVAACPVHAQKGEGWEAAARRQRYWLLRKMALDCGARFVATAHTADDQAETVLHRIIRGTGPAGLRGIPRVRLLHSTVTLVRPLLAVRRSEVIRYLAQLGQDFRTDETNRQLRFTRNRIRHELLPLLADRYNPNVVDALLRLSRLAAQLHEIIQPLAGQLAEQAVVERSDEMVRLSRRAIVQQPAYLIGEMLKHIWRQQHWPQREMSWAKWNQLAHMITCQSDEQLQKLTLPGHIVAHRSGDDLVLTRRVAANRSFDTQTGELEASE